VAPPSLPDPLRWQRLGAPGHLLPALTFFARPRVHPRARIVTGQPIIVSGQNRGGPCILS
jgi:hypothetical protein